MPAPARNGRRGSAPAAPPWRAGHRVLLPAFVCVTAAALGGGCTGSTGGNDDRGDTDVGATGDRDTIPGGDTDPGGDSTLGGDAEHTATDCRELGCSGPGVACHMLTGECVPNDRCLESGQPCDPAVLQPLGFECRVSASGEATCVRVCNRTRCDTGDTCSASGICVEDSCAGALDTTTCAPAERCEPSGPPGDGALAFCVPLITAGAVGERCSNDRECAAGLLCIGGTCTLPDCQPSGAGLPCPAGAGCVADDWHRAGTSLTELDVGVCTDGECDVVADTGCAAGERCTPLARDRVNGGWLGQCALQGIGEAGDFCSAMADCSDGFFCNGSTCEAGEACVLGSVAPEPGACTGEAFCFASSTLAGIGFCLPAQCELLAPVATCDIGQRCLPGPTVLRSASGALLGRCNTVVSLNAAGQPCASHFECGQTLGCWEGVCTQGCDLDPPAGAPDYCGSETCGEAPGARPPVGLCGATSCDPYVSGSGCGETEMCVASPEVWSFSLFVQGGVCVPAGTLPEGSPCNDPSLNECAEGLLCSVNTQSPLGAVCAPACGSAIASSCADGAACLELRPGLGACALFCTPLVDEGACPPGTQCTIFPTQLGTPAEPQCAPVGAGGPGSPCLGLFDPSCGAGLSCDGVVCVPRCATGAAAGEPFGCAAGAVCTEPFAETGVGVCRPTCTFGEMPDSCPDGTACTPPEVARTSAIDGVCIYAVPAGAPCEPGRACAGGRGVCLPALPELGAGGCTDVCRESQGDLLRLGHPDCSDPDAICAPLGDYVGLGFCSSG